MAVSDGLFRKLNNFINHHVFAVFLIFTAKTDTLFPNLPYRRFPIGRTVASSEAFGAAKRLRVGNPRYSRFGNRYCAVATPNTYPACLRQARCLSHLRMLLDPFQNHPFARVVEDDSEPAEHFHADVPGETVIHR